MTKHAGVTGIGDVVRQRVVFDPTAEMASGVSGGGWASYYFSRFRPQHVTGVYAMGSWMGVIKTTPGLSHTLETSSSLAGGSWQKTACAPTETSTAWSATPAIAPEVKAAFYRIRSTPTPSTSPVDPGQ